MGWFSKEPRKGISEFIVSLSINGDEKMLSDSSCKSDLLGVSIMLKESKGAELLLFGEEAWDVL